LAKLIFHNLVIFQHVIKIKEDLGHFDSDCVNSQKCQLFDIELSKYDGIILDKSLIQYEICNLSGNIKNKIS